MSGTTSFADWKASQPRIQVRSRALVLVKHTYGTLTTFSCVSEAAKVPIVVAAGKEEVDQVFVGADPNAAQRLVGTMNPATETSLGTYTLRAHSDLVKSAQSEIMKYALGELKAQTANPSEELADTCVARAVRLRDALGSDLTMIEDEERIRRALTLY